MRSEFAAACKPLGRRLGVSLNVGTRVIPAVCAPTVNNGDCSNRATCLRQWLQQNSALYVGKRQVGALQHVVGFGTLFASFWRAVWVLPAASHAHQCDQGVNIATAHQVGECLLREKEEIESAAPTSIWVKQRCSVCHSLWAAAPSFGHRHTLHTARHLGDAFAGVAGSQYVAPRMNTSVATSWRQMPAESWE